ncbi:poly(A) binding protein 2 [Actinidia rufa]|uniref:Poly(A) binding protein 2 n=1 Tax=Actinidia rufa TaxID=165716 RepID=A0A7J0DS70_9ERIC|nr:poly(A) binding protein 2 [Actinidia rufa]
MAQVQVQVPPQAVNAGGNQFVTTSLYVGDLELNVTDSQLYDLFNQLGQVVSVRVCRDLTTRRSLGYGYVNYTNPQDAARALEVLNFTPLNGKSIRIMYSHRDPSVRKSGAGNIFIKNLDKAIDHKALHDTFSSFGNILSCKVATDSSGQSKGYGFVQYDSDEAAQKAIEKLNGMLLNDKQVYVGPFLRKQERDMAMDKAKFTNVFVKNLSESTTEEDLKNIFGEFGTITSAVVMRDADGNSKCFGFVNFENADDAARAVDALNGLNFDNKEWYVGKAQKKSDRELELKFRFEQSVKEAADKSQGLNLYVKNLDDSVGDDDLKELFSPFGTITSCKVMRDPNGISKGSGFVAYSTPEEASRALLEMNGKMVASKPLYVAHAQRKEDRRARLQVQFFSNASSYNGTFSCSYYANLPPWWSWSWTTNILWTRSACYHTSPAWFWVSAATFTRHEAWWGSHAEFLCANGSAGSASWWQACRSRSSAAGPATSSAYAAADAFKGSGLPLSPRAWPA